MAVSILNELLLFSCVFAAVMGVVLASAAFMVP
jgi:hypothetical protein